MDDKHVHEWYTAGTFEGVTVAACGGVGCDAYLESGEIAQRLNATERLSAEAARGASHYIRQILEWAIPELTGKKATITHSELEDYASALEGATP